MRILLAPATYYPKVGGVEEVARQLARELRRRGHAVEVLTNRWRGVGTRAVVEEVDVRYVPFVLPGPSLAERRRFLAGGPRASAVLLARLRSFRPDVVHVIAAGPIAAYLVALRRLVRARVVVTSQGEVGIASDRIFHRSRALRWAMRRVLAEADAVTACSQFVLDELRSEFGVSAPQTVIPNGVDPAELAVPPADEGRYVFAAGRLAVQKGFDVLLQAFAGAGDDLAQHRLLVAGEGRERERLEGLASQLGLPGRVEWLGAADRRRLAELLGGAEVVVVPSRQEPFGIILLEALAAGKPAIASRVGGIPEFADGAALLVPPEDPAELAAALVRVVRDPELRASLAEAGRARAAEYTWSRIADRYEAVYRGSR
jgi:glycogen(starch) synthase